MTLAAETFCVNHPQTPTLLRCNRCNRPVCLKCVERTPVGYRCRECLGLQRAGYFTAHSYDNLIALGVALGVALWGGAFVELIGGFWLASIFVGPIAGGIIAETVRFAIQKRRGRYIALLACFGVIIGTLLGAGLTVVAQLFLAYGEIVPLALVLAPLRSLTGLFSLGMLIYLGFVVITLYARLRV